MKIDPSPRDIGKIVDDTLILYRANFRPLALGSLALLFPVVLVASVAGGEYYASFIDLMLTDLGLGGGAVYAQEPEAAAVFFVLQALIAILVPVRLVAVVWLSSSVYRSTSAWMAERTQTMRSFLASGKHRALHLGVVQLLTGVIGQVIYSIVLVVAFLISLSSVGLLSSGGTAGIVLGFVLATVVVVAGLLTYLLALSPFQAWGPAVVIEEAGIGSGLTRSFSLTKERRWRTVWYWMTVWMVSYAFRALIYAPAGLFFANAVLPFIQDPATAELSIPIWVTVALGVSAALAEALVMPFERACWAQYYLDLRSRGEAMDLVIRAREMSTADA